MGLRDTVGSTLELGSLETPRGGLEGAQRRPFGVPWQSIRNYFACFVHNLCYFAKSWTHLVKSVVQSKGRLPQMRRQVLTSSLPTY